MSPCIASPLIFFLPVVVLPLLRLFFTFWPSLVRYISTYFHREILLWSWRVGVFARFIHFSSNNKETKVYWPIRKFIWCHCCESKLHPPVRSHPCRSSHLHIVSYRETTLEPPKISFPFYVECCRKKTKRKDGEESQIPFAELLPLHIGQMVCVCVCWARGHSPVATKHTCIDFTSIFRSSSFSSSARLSFQLNAYGDSWVFGTTNLCHFSVSQIDSNIFSSPFTFCVFALSERTHRVSNKTKPNQI